MLVTVADSNSPDLDLNLESSMVQMFVFPLKSVSKS